MQIYAAARQFMKENGNPDQWKDIFPELKTIENDIEVGNHYLCLDEDDNILVVFAYIYGDDPTYHEINGKWLNNGPYGVVHRIASSNRRSGAAYYCLDWAYQQCHNLRIDTHQDNVPMQNLIRKLGFDYCGIIKTHDGTDRLAFQKFEGMELLKQIREYEPVNEQEEKDRQLMIDVLENDVDLFSRRNPYHFTASAWITNRQHDRILMAYHNIYDSYSWLGGHCDGDSDTARVCLKEVNEESGLSNIRLLDEKICSLEVLTVAGHMKNGRYVSGHLHFNVTYYVEGDDSQTLTVRPQENKSVRWFDFDQAPYSSSEPWFINHIYLKLNEKLKRILKEKEND